MQEQGYLFNDAEHVHTLRGKPLTGTSTALGIIGKPGLVYWAAGEAVKILGWTPGTKREGTKYTTLPLEPRITHVQPFFDKIKSSTPEEFLKLLDTAYKAHTGSLKKSATKGKDLHSLLEKYVKFCIEKNEGQPANVASDDIQKFIDWSVANVDTFLGSEVNTYSEKHWVGGIIDAVARLKTGKNAIIDFKSAKAVYPTHWFQCAGYGIQLAETGGFTPTGERTLEPLDCETYIVVPFGAEEFKPEIIHDEKMGIREGFLSALNLYRANEKLDTRG